MSARGSIAVAVRILALALAASVALALAATGASAAEIAYPDLQVLMPTGEISIHHTSTTRTLEFTHISWDAGAGPWELRPTYNSATGISQGYQALYTMTKPGVWAFDHTVPIAGPMIWDPPSDYRFPLDSFALYTVASGGGLGTRVATSPKVDFCMTSDTFVGGVPNSPSTNGYPSGACNSPEGKLGLSVGWGDQYDATDGGEGIEITSLANGTYWLRGQTDPYHYFQESNRNNNITDTKLQIEGNTVKVIEQVKPEEAPPTVTLTTPSEGQLISGNVNLSATATGPSEITSVQFLLDGQPIGSPVTKAPYTLSYNLGSTTPGSHFLSAQATAVNGLVGTAADTKVNVAKKIGTLSIDTSVTGTGKTTAVTPAFSTSEAGELLMAFGDADGPSTGAQSMTVSGAGLTWTLVRRSNAQHGDAEIWSAKAPSKLSGATVTATATATGFAQALTVVAITGAEGIGSSSAAAAASGAPTISMLATHSGSLAFGTGNDWSKSVARTLGAGQEMLSQTLESGSGDTFWTQYQKSPSAEVGQTMTVNDTAPTSDVWNMAAVEVIPAPGGGTDTEPPSVSIINPVNGKTVSNTAQVAASAVDNVAVSSVQFYLDGKPLGSPVTAEPYAIPWDTTTAANGPHTLTAVATDPSGNKGTSQPVEVTVQNPPESEPCFVMDANSHVEGTGTVTTAPVTDAEAGEWIFAFISSDGPAGAGKQTAKPSGGLVKWKLVKRANGQTGDAEIWAAFDEKQVKNVKFKSVQKVKTYDQSLTVITMQASNGAGASAGGSAASGEPSVTLNTTKGGALVYGVGEDPASAASRTLGSNQVLLRQDLDATAGKTFWSQYTGAITGLAGETVTLADPAPTSDPWNMAAVEILPDEA